MVGAQCQGWLCSGEETTAEEHGASRSWEGKEPGHKARVPAQVSPASRWQSQGRTQGLPRACSETASRAWHSDHGRAESTHALPGPPPQSDT